LVVSVAVGTWAAANVGWARKLFAGSLFPPGPGRRRTTCRSASSWRGSTGRCETRSKNTDSCLILSAALLTRSQTLLLLAALYLAQLALQLPLEERELEERFGAPCRRYCDLVPLFVSRHRPVKQREFDPKTSGYRRGPAR
jgi:hypothetical protein